MMQPPGEMLPLRVSFREAFMPYTAEVNRANPTCFLFLWEYRSAFWAGRFLRDWCAKVMRSRIEPMKEVARMLRSHEELLLNWFKAKGTISAGSVERLNYNAKLTMRKAYGFRTLRGVKIALYHRLGALPEPQFAHEFC
jgi:transposase